MTRSENKNTKAEDWKSAGLCTQCGKPVEPGKTLCAVHLERLRVAASLRREKRIAEGLCVGCGKPAIPGQTLCEEHSNKNKKEAALRRERARELKPAPEPHIPIKVIRKQSGLCTICGDPVCERSTIYCDKHRIAHNQREILRQKKNVEEGKCRYCAGELFKGQRCKMHYEKEMEKQKHNA